MADRFHIPDRYREDYDPDPPERPDPSEYEEPEPYKVRQAAGVSRDACLFCGRSDLPFVDGFTCERCADGT